MPLCGSNPAHTVSETQYVAARQRMEVEALGLGAEGEHGIVRRPPNGQFAGVGFANAVAAGHDPIAGRVVGGQQCEDRLFHLLHVYVSASRCPSPVCSAVNCSRCRHGLSQFGRQAGQLIDLVLHRLLLRLLLGLLLAGPFGSEFVDQIVEPIERGGQETPAIRHGTPGFRSGRSVHPPGTRMD